MMCIVTTNVSGMK